MLISKDFFGEVMQKLCNQTMQDAVNGLEHRELHFRTGLHGNTNGLYLL